MLLNAVSAAIHTDTHFEATNNVLPEATYHLDVGETKNWAEHHFLNFCFSVKTCLFSSTTISYIMHLNHTIVQN